MQNTSVMKATDKETLKFIRLAAIGAALIYPSWHFIYTFLFNGVLDDPLWERMVVVGYVSLIFSSTYIPSLRRYSLTATYVGIYCTHAHLFSLTYRNNVDPAYQMGMVCLVACLAPYFSSVRALGLYFIFNILCMLIGYFVSFEPTHLLFFGVILTVIAMTWAVLDARLKVIQKVRDSKKIIETKSRDLLAILDNIPLGVMALKFQSGSIEMTGEHSAHLETIVGKDKLEGQSIVNLLSKNTSLSKEELSNIRSFLIISQDEELFAWDVNAHLLPTQTQLKAQDRLKYLSLQWHPVVGKKSKLVEQTLLIIRDETDLMQARMDSEQKRFDIELLMQITSIHPIRLNEFFNTAKTYLNRSNQKLELHKEKADENLFIEAYRDLHTLKGLARSFGFKNLSEAIHCLEDSLEEFKSQTDDTLNLRNEFDAVFSVLDRYKHVNSEILRRDNDSGIQVQKEFLETHAHSLKAISEEIPEFNRPALGALVYSIESLYHDTLSSLLEQEIKSLSSLSERLGKEIPNLNIVNDEYFINNDYKDALRFSFIHLIRNSLDHGIETAEVRLNHGKSTKGSITISVNQVGSLNYQIILQDDGKGLNMEKIEEIAKQKGLYQNEGMTPPQLAQFIFNPGFTTAAHTTEVSGRGIGMDAVRATLDKVGLGIEIQLFQTESEDKAHTPFRIIITCPKEVMIPIRFVS